MKTETKVFAAEEKRSRLGALLSGVLIGYAVTCVVFIGYAMLITYTSVTGEALPLVVTVTSLLSVMLAGFDAAKGAENRGWLWGIFAGLLYAIILVLIGLWVNKGFALDTRTVTLFVLSVAGGGLGGVLGINFKKK